MVTLIETAELGSWKLLKLKGRVDSFCDKRIIAQIKALIEADNQKRWIFDLTQTDFLSIIFIREMLLLYKTVRTQNGQIILMGPQVQVRKYLDSFSGALGPKIYRTEKDLRFELGFPVVDHSHDFSPASFSL